MSRFANGSFFTIALFVFPFPQHTAGSLRPAVLGHILTQKFGFSILQVIKIIALHLIGVDGIEIAVSLKHGLHPRRLQRLAQIAE